MDVGLHHASRPRDATKTSLIAVARDDAQRAACQARLTQRAAGDFVMVDETGRTLTLTPRAARAPRGQRAYGTAPRTTPPNTTLIAGMSPAGMGAAMVLEDAPDTVAGDAYGQQFLAPPLQPGQVVVLDKLSAHKRPRIRTAIEACGGERGSLSADSPDLSPTRKRSPHSSCWCAGRQRARKLRCSMPSPMR